jgi:hypothetical protein
LRLSVNLLRTGDGASLWIDRFDLRGQRRDLTGRNHSMPGSPKPTSHSLFCCGAYTAGFKTKSGSANCSQRRT